MTEDAFELDGEQLTQVTSDLQSAVDGLCDLYFDVFDVDSVIDLPTEQREQLDKLQSVLDTLLES